MFFGKGDLIFKKQIIFNDYNTLPDTTMINYFHTVECLGYFPSSTSITNNVMSNPIATFKLSKRTFILKHRSLT